MKINQETNCLTLVAEEDFLFNKAEKIQATLVKALESCQSTSVVLDLTQTTVMDSIGIKLLLGLYKSCQQKGLSLQVDVSSETIIRLFQLCQLHNLLNIREVQANV